MQSKGSIVAASVMGLMIGSAATSASAALLSVDFDSNYASLGGGISPTQPGFESAVVGVFESTALEYTFGDYVVSTQDTVADADANFTQSGARDRTVSDPTVSPFYRDFVFANASNGNRFGLLIEGLDASTAYAVDFWAYDANSSRTVTISQVGNPLVTGAIAYVGSVQPDDLSDYMTTLTATSDASGALFFEVSSATGDALLNGFQINAVPEPSSMALAGLGAALIMVGRRRQN